MILLNRKHWQNTYLPILTSGAGEVYIGSVKHVLWNIILFIFEVGRFINEAGQQLLFETLSTDWSMLAGSLFC